jgi:hypothetical protein
MEKRVERHAERLKKVAPYLTRPEGQLYRDVGAFEELFAIGEQPVQNPVKERIRGWKGRPEEILDAALDLGGDDGRDHVSSQTSQ